MGDKWYEHPEFSGYDYKKGIDYIEFDGYAIPKVLTLSDTGHLYREGLPLKYNYGDSF